MPALALLGGGGFRRSDLRTLVLKASAHNANRLPSMAGSQCGNLPTDLKSRLGPEFPAAGLAIRGWLSNSIKRLDCRTKWLPLVFPNGHDFE